MKDFIIEMACLSFLIGAAYILSIFIYVLQGGV
jgi:hypothetical protein